MSLCRSLLYTFLCTLRLRSQFAVRPFIRSFVRLFVRPFTVHCSLFTVHYSYFVRSFGCSFVRSFVRAFVRSFVQSVVRTYVGRRVKQKLLLCGPRLQLRCKSAARFCASAVRCSALSSTSSSSSLSLLLLFLPPPPPPSSLLLLVRDVAALRRFCACNVVARGPTNRSQSTAARNRLRPHASNCFELLRIVAADERLTSPARACVTSLTFRPPP